jgi:hypothetical protein
MDAFKADFSKEHGVDWEFQNDVLETRYKEFCKKASSSDEQLMKDMADYEQEKAKIKAEALNY